MPCRGRYCPFHVLLLLPRIAGLKNLAAYLDCRIENDFSNPQCFSASNRRDGVNIDVTERKAMEESLQQCQSRLQLVVDALGAGLWSMDLRDYSVEESDKFVAMLGLPPGTRH